jgi:DNA-binding response OmpR family regulator
VNPEDFAVTKSHKKIWILEDDPGCAFVYEDILASAFDVRIFNCIQDLEDALTHSGCDLLIADLGLPDGLFLRCMRSPSRGLMNHRSKPLLIVSQLADENMLRTCFSNGASDYLIKPFHECALKVKVEVLLAQAEAPASAPIEFDPVQKKVRTSDQLVAELTPREMQICVAIATKPQQSIRKHQLIMEVWQDVKVTDGTLDVHLCNLRKKLRKVSYDISHQTPDLYKITPMAVGHSHHRGAVLN